MGEDDALTFGCYFARAKIDLQRASTKRLRIADTLTAAQKGTDARQKLARVERFSQVVVGADLEAHDLVDVVALSREHENGEAGELWLAADLLANGQTILAWQHEIQKHDIKCR